MEELGRNLIEVEFHQLEMPLAPSRLKNRKALLRLIRSIEAYGQSTPVLAVRIGEKLFLLDGHLRVEALRYCGKDTVWVEWMRCDLANGLLMMLGRNQGRQWEPLEEAEIIRQLICEHQKSRQEVARALGKDPSWVSRRLALVTDLPEPVLEAVKQGQIGSWVANRVLAPLARANSEHALSLLAALTDEPLSSRDLDFFLHCYQSSPKKVRDRMIGDPHLFVKASRYRQKEQKAKKLVEGPEELLLADLQALVKKIRGLRERTDALATAGALADREDLLEAFDHVDTQWRQLKNSVDRSCHDPGTDSNRDCGNVCPGNVQAGDQSETECLSQDSGTSVAQRGTDRKTETGKARQRSGVDSSIVPKLQGQRGSCPGTDGTAVCTANGLQHVDQSGPRGSP
ncbi:MAG: ParB/RepB/Spo0J family partition protein [Gammaproteobacteria bacterium]|nr:ParB/RepB/Spo0J family partition protein [Gammaproteobacteria bacterium]